MPQRCTVCDHPKLKEIDLALVQAKQSNRVIARQFELNHDAIRRHKADHLPLTLLRGYEAQKEADALSVMAELERCVKHTNKMLAACDAWLTDPEDPARYSLEPRTEEVTVIYTETGDDGKPQRKRAQLTQLLPKVEKKKGRTVESWEVKRADPRDLILKTIAQLRPQAELLARLEGKIKDNPNINILINPEWVEMRAKIITALLPFPDARVAVAAALMLEGDGSKPIHTV